MKTYPKIAFRYTFSTQKIHLKQKVLQLGNLKRNLGALSLTRAAPIQKVRPLNQLWLLSRRNPCLEVPVDTGRSNAIPTINVKDVDEQEVENEKPFHPLSSQPSPPGAMPSTLSPQIPDWYKAGWRAVSGIDAPPAAEGEEKDKGILDMFLAEQYYGSWYHNAALIVFVRLLANIQPTYISRE
jgi:hypothetical protein